MSYLPRISGKDAIKIFEKARWRVRGQVGSHTVMTKDGVRVNLTVPNHKEWHEMRTKF